MVNESLRKENRRLHGQVAAPMPARSVLESKLIVTDCPLPENVEVSRTGAGTGDDADRTLTGACKPLDEYSVALVPESTSVMMKFPPTSGVAADRKNLPCSCAAVTADEAKVMDWGTVVTCAASEAKVPGAAVTTGVITRILLGGDCT